MGPRNDLVSVGDVWVGLECMHEVVSDFWVLECNCSQSAMCVYVSILFKNEHRGTFLFSYYIL